MASGHGLSRARQWLLRHAAPEDSLCRRLLRAGKRSLLALRPRRSLRPYEPFQGNADLDLFDGRSLAAFAQQCHVTGLKWSLRAAARDELGAARLVLGLLHTRGDLRSRFPEALCGGRDGHFCRWLCSAGALELGLSDRVVAQIEAAFSRRLGARPLQIYDYDRNARRVFPLALTPAQLAAFGHFLFTSAKFSHGLADEEVWWFLFERAQDPGKGIVATYLRSPEWQARFPFGLTVFGWAELLDWVREHYQLPAAWLASLELPAVYHPVDELRLLHAFAPRLQALVPEAFRKRRDNQRLLHWLREQQDGPKKGVWNFETGEFQIPFFGPGTDWWSRLQAGVDAGMLEQPGVNVLGHFCYPSGLGEAAKATLHGLQRAGVRTSCRNVPASFENDRPHHADYLGVELFDCTLIHVAPEPVVERTFDLSALRVRDGVYRIAVWYWELEKVPPEFVKHAAALQEIWAPTRFIARAMRDCMPIPVTEMLPGVQLGAVPALPRSHFGLPDDRYLFFFMFDMCSIMERKNPLGLIRAYQQAFRGDDRVALAIKVSRGQCDRESFQRLRRAAEDAGVIVIDGVLAREEAYGLMRCCDCYASLHRSEGFGLTLAEAMLMGKPVIATAYSGNLDFTWPSNSLLVESGRVAITEVLPFYPQGSVWAEPSLDQAASHLRWAYEHQDDARALGAVAQADLTSLLSFEAAGKRMARRLREIEEQQRQRLGAA
jgi:glycosyltransferase involved in cell wall biosynthesis